ncbi:cell division protein ZipA [Halomonas sp. BM-2019]|uniref:cell division protein ZipA n=1 Tax=Halomonas sp. BM-2019 TaxID=2811227 RepID=UPI001B3C48AD|nr:MAG: cell division protein ZipA [Halomonas sp. BM-2019]
MELREWLIILGLALVTLIVVDGARRLQRQRRVPRLDEAVDETRAADPDELAREAEINWELPNGGARVVRPADYSQVQPKPKLERQEHPGPSSVLSSFRRQAGQAPADPRPAVGSAEAGARVAPSASPGAEAREPQVPPRADAAPVAPPGQPSDADQAGRQAHRAEPTRREAESAPAAESVAPAASRPASTPASDTVPTPAPASDTAPTPGSDAPAEAKPAAESPRHEAPRVETEPPTRREPSLSALDDDGVPASAAEEPLVADPEDHDDYHQEAERYRLVDLEGMSDSLKSGSKRVGVSMQRFGASLQKTLAERREQKRLEKARREQAKAEKAALEAERRRLAREQAEAEQAAREAERRRLEAQAIAEADDYDPLFAPPRARQHGGGAYRAAPEPGDAGYRADDADGRYDETLDLEASLQSDKVRVHPVLEKALRHDVSAEHARETLAAADELIVISVMSRDEEGFSGPALLDLMLACGLRYDREMGVFHRFETEDPESRLQFSMVNVVKPGTFPIAAMDDFRTPGITLLMPLPGAEDTSVAFEAMVETAMVIVRHLGGELKDENHSVMTAQTVEFARQRVQEFVRRHRLHRYQVN